MTQPGWYPDQNGGTGMKYWDGKAWHDSVPAAPPALPPIPPPTARPPAALPPAGNGSVSRRNSILSGIAGFVVTIGGFLILANWVSHSGGDTAPVTSNIAVPELQMPATVTPPTPKPVPMGTSLEVDTYWMQLDMNPPHGRLAVMVSDLVRIEGRPLGTLASGDLYAVSVTLQVLSGPAVPINPCQFAARTTASVQAECTVIGLPDELPMTQVAPGQKLAGRIVFDVPAGQIPTDILMSGAGMTQLGWWTTR